MSLQYYRSLMNQEKFNPFEGFEPRASYCFYKVNPNYSGDSFEAFRVSDSATQDIGFTSDGEADIAALESFASGGTTLIRTWYDQWNGYDLVQNSGTFMPNITDGSGNAITRNGKLVCQGVGSDTYMVSTGFNFNGTTTVNNYSYAGAFEIDASTGVNQTILSKGGIGANNGIRCLYLDSTSLLNYRLTASGSPANINGSSISASTLYVFEDYGDNSNHEAYLNNSSEGTASYTGNIYSADDLHLFSRSDTQTQNFDGLMYELHIWNDNEEANRSIIYSTINDRY